MKSLLPFLAVEEYTGSGSGMLPPWEILHEAHLKLLCFSVANNFAGLPDFSRNLIWDFVRKQASVLELLHLAPGPTTKVLAEKFFTCAIESGDVQAVEYLLRKGDVDANEHVCIVEDVPYTPVELSVRTQNIRTAKLLISYKANVNKTYGEGYFRKQGALQHAIEPCTRGSHVEPELVHILLDAGARVDSETVGTTIKKSYAQIAEIIIKRVARVNHDLWNKVGIFHAVFAYLDIGTATRIFQLILEVDANINISLNIFPLDSLDRLVWDPYADGKTLLDIAAQRGQIDLVETVLRHGAFLTEDTLTCAIQSTNKDVISYVLHRGAKVNSLATFGETPYSEAVRAGYMDLVQLLEDKGALDEIEDRPRFKAAVCAASEVGNLGVLKHLVEKIADLNHDMHVELGYALVEAVMAGHEKVALFLIDADADVNVSARYGEHFALHRALQRKMKNLVRALLNVDVALYRMRDARLLQAAIEWGDHSIIKDLIFAGAGINDSIYSRFHGAYEVPLTMAIDRNDIELVRLLLAEGANINCSYAKDRSALTTAVNRGNIDMVHFLLEEGADPADTIALVEATSQSPSFVHLLLEAFAKRYPRSKRGYGSEAAVKAIEEDNFEMLEVLLKSNADFSTCWENRQGLCEAPLACAIMKNKLAMVQRLIDRGLDLNDIVAVGEARVLLPPPPPRQSSPPSPITRYRPTNPDSQPPLPPPSSNFDRPRLAIPPRFTALLVAVRINDPEMLQTLIDAGAKVNLAATRGIKRTPLQMAAELGKMTALQVLIKNGAAINAKPAEDAGGTALQLAAIGGFLGIAEELLKRGADVNALPSKRQGRTALEGAVEHGRIDMVRFLLNAGAEIGSPGHRQYERLLKLAKKKKATESFFKCSNRFRVPTRM
jgi:ankyrin repeat protein